MQIETRKKISILIIVYFWQIRGHKREKIDKRKLKILSQFASQMQTSQVRSLLEMKGMIKVLLEFGCCAIIVAIDVATAWKFPPLSLKICCKQKRFNAKIERKGFWRKSLNESFRTTNAREFWWIVGPSGCLGATRKRI